VENGEGSVSAGGLFPEDQSDQQIPGATIRKDALVDRFHPHFLEHRDARKAFKRFLIPTYPNVLSFSIVFICARILLSKSFLFQATFTFPQCRGCQTVGLSLIRRPCRQKEYG
jgi:hypothetical protein